MIQFAAMKLLGGRQYLKEANDLSNAQKLACLSQRLPIEFSSCTYSEQAEEMEQVEGHMRICLKVDSGFESMQTVSPSEPLLSEASYLIMANPSFDAPNALAKLLTGYAINKGDRGELLVMLVATLARDSGVGPPAPDGRPTKSRSLSVLSYFRALFKPGLTAKHIDVLKMHGYVVSPHKVERTVKTFQDEFKNALVYCNHWVKVHQHSLLNKRVLLCMLARGAGVLCGTNNFGVDMVQPFLYNGPALRVDNLGLILKQVKNDMKYNHHPDLSLFDKMDPVTLGFFDEQDQNSFSVPVIRIVFALAAKTPSLQVVRINSSNHSFTVYDIWCSGLSSGILCPVSQQQNDVWQSLLQVSYGWERIYKDAPQSAQHLRRAMNPGAGTDPAHWLNWCSELP
jgi:hypothetical protein